MQWRQAQMSGFKEAVQSTIPNEFPEFVEPVLQHDATDRRREGEGEQDESVLKAKAERMKEAIGLSI